MNRATLLGHVGKDPEIRTTQNGTKVATFRLATSDRWTDKQSGEKREQTEWHTIVVWNENLVPIIEKYVAKGSKLLIEGAIRTREWEAQDGSKRWSTEIVLSNFNSTIQLLDAKPSDRPPPADAPPQGRPVADRGQDGQKQGQDVRQHYAAPNPPSPPPNGSGGHTIDDQIPF